MAEIIFFGADSIDLPPEKIIFEVRSVLCATERIIFGLRSILHAIKRIIFRVQVIFRTAEKIIFAAYAILRMTERIISGVNEFFLAPKNYFRLEKIFFGKNQLFNWIFSSFLVLTLFLSFLFVGW